MNGVAHVRLRPGFLWKRLISFFNKIPDEQTITHQSSSRLLWLFRCWHRKMSRPFTRDGCTYRVCLRCGMRRNFDLEKWKMTGSYYYAKNWSDLRELSITKGTKR